MKFGILVILSISLHATANVDSKDWLNLLKAGKDREVAAIFSREAARLKPPISATQEFPLHLWGGGKQEKKKWPDERYVELLENTARALLMGCTCDEDLKFTVFRGFRPNETDFNLGTNKRPIIPSRGIYGNGRSNGYLGYSKYRSITNLTILYLEALYLYPGLPLQNENRARFASVAN